MISTPQMIFNCSIDTINQIFKEQSFAKELCETKISKALLMRDKYAMKVYSEESIKIEFSERHFTSYEINFKEVSESIVRCEVKGFSFITWLVLITIVFITGEVVKSNETVIFSFFLIFYMIVRAVGYYININTKCSRIKKNYERNETFLKMHNHFKSTFVGNNLQNRSHESDYLSVDEAEDLDPNLKVKSYFLNDGIKQEGPLSYKDLEGKISLQSYVWHDGIPHWVLAKELNELRSLIPQIPPPFNIQIEQQRNIPPSINLPAIPPVFNYKMK